MHILSTADNILETAIAISTLLLMGALILPLDTAHANQVQSTNLSEISSDATTYGTHIFSYMEFSLSDNTTNIFDARFPGKIHKNDFPLNIFF